MIEKLWINDFVNGILLYIILSIIIPEAKNTADRLAMRGEPIDVNSIAKSVGKGVEDISLKVNEFSNPENQERFKSQIHQASGKIGDAISLILRGMGGVWKIVIGALVVAMIVAMLISWVSGAIGLAMGYPFFGYITDSHFAPPIAIFSTFCLVSIPVILMVLFLRRLFFRRPAGGAVVGSLWAIWGISFAVLGVIAGKTAKQFNQKAEMTQSIDLANPSVETLTITTLNNPYGEINTQFGSVHISEDYLVSEDVNLRIVKSETDKFELVKNINSRGRNQDEARKYMSNVDYKMENVGSELRLSHEFQIPRGTKWRNQNVNLTLKVPVGKKIKIKKDDIGRRVNIDFNEIGDWEDNEACWDSDTAIWEMTAQGLKCATAKKSEE